MSLLEAYLCAEEATAARRALDQIADRAGRDDPRNKGQRRADALMSLILQAPAHSDEVALSTSGDRLSGVARPLVQLIVSADTIAGSSDAPAELVGHGPIPPALARRLAADGGWQRILADPVSGAIVDIGRTAIVRPRRWSTTSGPATRSVRFRPAVILRRNAISTTTFHTAGTARRRRTI